MIIMFWTLFLYLYECPLPLTSSDQTCLKPLLNPSHPYSTQPQYQVLRPWNIPPFISLHFWPAQITWRHCELCVCLLEEAQIFQTYSCVGLHTVVCWGENINAGDAGRTNKLAIKASFVAGLSLNTLEADAQERRRTVLNFISDNPFSSCPFYHVSCTSSLGGATQKHWCYFFQLLPVQIDLSKESQKTGLHCDGFISFHVLPFLCCTKQILAILFVWLCLSTLFVNNNNKKKSRKNSDCCKTHFVPHSL